MEDKLFVVNEIILENKSIGQVSREHNILRSTISVGGEEQTITLLFSC